MILMGVVACFFMTKYYIESCQRMPDGSTVPKEVHKPVGDRLSFASFIFGPVPSLFPVEVDKQNPLWQMVYPAGYVQDAGG